MKNTVPGGESPLDLQSTLNFFRAAGNEQHLATGSTIYREERRLKQSAPGAQIYLLVSGQVALTRNKRPLELVMPGEIFGATTVLCNSSRIATATVLKDAVIIGIDLPAFAKTLQRQPDFALILMRLLGARLQGSFARAAKLNLPELPPLQNRDALGSAQIGQLGHALGDPQPTRMEPGGKVISAGGVAMFMYVLIEGRIGIMLGESAVETIGPGGAFGEMALVGGGARAADAVVEVAASWYPIGRKELVHVTAASAELGMGLLRSLCRRVMHAGFLLSEPPARLAAMQLVRVDVGRMGGLKMFQGRTLRTFISEATALVARAESALAANDPAGMLAAARALREQTLKVGADRLGYYAGSLETALTTGPREAAPNVVAALRDELQDTCDEVREAIGG